MSIETDKIKKKNPKTMKNHNDFTLNDLTSVVK
jgi:hypothetical protein